MAGTLLHLLVLFLGISHFLICSNAAPITRTERLMHGPQVIIPEDTLQITEEKNSWKEDAVSDGRMLVSLNDYPGIGANNRHTPRPQFGRCVDC
ncbi:hypothetical protein Tsubulata_013053 [Turnera subulata]|uniref:Uncharacterized protein n=1 Tax=Turnera subulata TaxID=218843 RepID=A0A9Q0F513_9ROSI|nr:hypothetical protein Tsubulata_013053 [Turnera subulata]